MKIALFGAAGAMGRSIAKAVSAQGAPYRVVGRSPVLMDDSALQGLLGPIQKTPYPDGIRECLAAIRP